MNRVTLIGFSGSDAEVKETNHGGHICNFSLATSEKQSDGTFKPTWHRIVLFGKLALNSGPRIKKGFKLFIDGKINVNDWTDQTGAKRTNVDIIAFSVFIIEKEQPSSFTERQPIPSKSIQDEDDLPF